MDAISFNQEIMNQANVDIAVLKTELASLRRDVDSLAVAVSLDGRSWLRASFLPKVKTGAGGVSLSVEFSI